MHKKIIAIGALAVAPLLNTTSYAQQFHPSDQWDKVRVGGRLCFAEHEHYGKSPLWVSKRGARAAAIRAWIASTQWEYGKTWASYRLAAGKRMSCSRQGAKWFCETSARPCRGRGRR